MGLSDCSVLVHRIQGPSQQAELPKTMPLSPIEQPIGTLCVYVCDVRLCISVCGQLGSAPIPGLCAHLSLLLPLPSFQFAMKMAKADTRNIPFISVPQSRI